VRYFVITDLHANMEALEAVLEAVPPSAYDRVLVLGDLVGYGADPNAVIDRVRGLDPLVLIRGNHDKVACGLEDASGFNLIARQAIEWTYMTLTPEHRQFLTDLPAGPQFVNAELEVCHGSPFDEDAYIFDQGEAVRALEAMERPICLYGHTHIPAVFTPDNMADDAPVTRDGSVALRLGAGGRYLINPGSVGQPRDGDPRAACAVFDEDARELIIHRVAYRVDVAQRKIIAAGLPEILASRLGIGR
jgi:diadenosine tetraphosphatase ApaH/serine/threonine PP2A family protein phosphatase